VLSSDKYSAQQKEIFKLRADSAFNNEKTKSNKDFNLGGVDFVDRAKDFGVYNAKNIKEFNIAWNKLINFYKTNKFSNDEKNPQAPTIYNTPGAAYQLENFKKEIMIQKGFTKIPSS
jgi:hypothetical protein